jgi:hypothetical protein
MLFYLIINALVPQSKLEVFLEMEREGLLSSSNLYRLEDLIDAVCPWLKSHIDEFKASEGKQTPKLIITSRSSFTHSEFT